MFYGGLLGGVLGGAIYCRIRKKSFCQMADLACMGLLIGQIIGKWGSFFNRESFGEYADNIFSMQLPLTAVRAGEVTTAMREKLQTVDGGTWIPGRDISEISGELWSGKSSDPVVPHR